MKRRTLFFLGMSGLAGCTGRRALRLNVFNWSNYVAPDTIARFEAESGARVRYAVYESNEEMLARAMTGNSGWDVVFPSHYFVGPMREMGLLAPLDPARLPGMEHLDPMFRDAAWAPDLACCAPYMWGSTGILFRPELKPGPRRWADLWDGRARGRLTMLDDPSEALGAALKMLGLSANSTGAGELRRAQAEALRQKPLLRAYLNAEVRDQVVAGDVLAAQCWSFIAQQAIDAAPQLRFHYPEEGFTCYADCAVVLRESRRAELAHVFLDYLLRPETAASIVLAARCGTANRTARQRLPREVRELETLFPSPETLARAEWFATMPAAAQRLRDRLWTEIKAA
jgi:spermidine/putrescine-binding protein